MSLTNALDDNIIYIIAATPSEEKKKEKRSSNKLRKTALLKIRFRSIYTHLQLIHRFNYRIVRLSILQYRLFGSTIIDVRLGRRFSCCLSNVLYFLRRITSFLRYIFRMLKFVSAVRYRLRVYEIAEKSRCTHILV